MSSPDTSTAAADAASAEASRLAAAKAVAGTALGYLQVGSSVAASYVSRKASERWAAASADGAGNSADISLRGLGSAEVLKVAATLDGIFSSGELRGAGGRLEKPEVPRLVVVGTQSSGKSSLLNGIMGADILPLGEQMVTRAPLSLQLVHTADASAMRAEFGDFARGVWNVLETVALTCPDPTSAQAAQLRAAIETQTASRAGDQKGVSSQPIFMRLYSPHVPNLSLVDLPGLTMTALTAQGQPKDIKQQIRQMVASYISQARTIILMVCPARADLEADPAVELAREYDPSGERTVGVLTKVDLMNHGTDISRYLTNTIATDLQLRHGYFACKMRGPSEATLSVRDGFGSEEGYFAQHPSYSNPNSPFAERLGVPNLTAFLSRVLLQHLRQHMPAILTEVTALHAATERNLAELGPSVPTDDASRSAYVQNVVGQFAREFVGALVEKRADVKTGRRIKDAFSGLQCQLKAVAPFGAETYSDAYLLEAVRDCEGNHLSFPIPPIELLEHMLTHPEHKPVRLLLPPCLGCLADVHEELRALCGRLLQQPPLSRFPRLQAKLREEVDALLERARGTSHAKLDELVSMEEAYIYTDDERFLQELSAAVKRLVTKLDAPLLRSILTSYYQTVVRTVTNAAPKAIMLHMVRSTQNAVHATLFDALSRSSGQLDTLLEESSDIETKRKADVELLTKLRAARRALESMS